MRIALIGYGKMGKAIEEIALQRKHDIVLRIHDQNLQDFTAVNLSVADVAIEFTGPHSAFNNVKQLLEWNVPVVSGSTGWIEKLPQLHDLCQRKQGCMLYASNFSVGVNIFFEINKRLAELMAARDEYEVEMEEIHHTAKLDAPSGTAITLAEHILENVSRKKTWINESGGQQDQLSIISRRVDPAPGTHSIKYSSAVDDIEITHTAHNRQGFALGAVLAAEFCKDKKGIFSMKDVLGL